MLMQALSPQNIRIKFRSNSKTQIAKELLQKHYQGKQLKILMEKIDSAEDPLAESPGKGIVIYSILLPGAPQIQVFLGVHKEGLDAESYDGEPLKIFVVVITPSKNREYIDTLAYILRLLRQDSVRHKMLQAKTPEELYQILLEEHREVEE